MRPGDYVTPNIRLMQHLGSGAMGSVWSAEHGTLSTLVAVKLMSPAYLEDTEFVERFRNEAKAAASIRSPHVVQMLDSGVTQSGEPFIVMELLEGETLGSRIRRIGPLPLDEVVRIVVQTANALGRAHQLGIVHRDIKPDNLFLIDVGGEPFVKVLDFGVAKQPPGVLSVPTDPGRVMGTPFYMSPEQLVSSKYVDHRTDVWALAAVAYEALTAEPPFKGASIGAQVLAVHAGEFKKPSELRSGIPEAVDAWATRALQRDPEARFGSTRELADALEQVVRKATAAAMPVALDQTAMPPSLATAPSAYRTEPDRSNDPTLPVRRVEVLSVSSMPTTPRSIEPLIEPVVHHSGTLVSGMSAQESRYWASASPELAVGNRRIRLVLGNLGATSVEAVVNPTDRSLSIVDAAIRAAGGPEIAEELGRISDRAGKVTFVTGAGQLAPATRIVIHAVAPAYNADRASECAAELREAYQGCLRAAEDHGVHTIAFPAISAGVGEHPTAAAAEIAIGAILKHFAGPAQSVDLVVFFLSSKAHLTAFSAALEEAAIATARTLNRDEPMQVE